jgi:membrane protein implicated in regulation of membrane protease activity
MPRFTLLAFILAALALAAAVVSVFAGFWLGLGFILLAGLSSNIGWVQWRRARLTVGRA